VKEEEDKVKQLKETNKNAEVTMGYVQRGEARC
jgi:hypothetical protein